MRLEFETADVFTEARFGGNPLAVVFGAGALDGAAMQRLAREFNLSETVFVMGIDGETARIRIFTPGSELPFAGHPNVGAAVLLARRLGIAGERVLLDQTAGRVVARLARDGAGVVTGAEIEAPRPFTEIAPFSAEAAAACAGLPVSAIVARAHAPLIGGCGNSIAFAELADEAALAAASPDAAAFRTHLPVSAATGLYLHAPLADGRRRGRMFGPLEGIPEDPATGSANVGLAALLLRAAGGERIALEVEQGIEMGRPSRLAIRAWRDAESGLRAAVGGGVVPVSQGTILADG
jgi:trans-2,3-dihydro-3-hydroxyanthranilate isomerase